MPMSPHAAERAILQRNKIITGLQTDLEEAMRYGARAQAINANLMATLAAVLLAAVGPGVEVRITPALVDEIKDNPLRYELRQSQDPETKALVFVVRQRSDEEIAELQEARLREEEERARAEAEAPASGLVGMDGAPLRQTAGKLQVVQ